jgi:hypothetical protein
VAASLVVCALLGADRTLGAPEFESAAEVFPETRSPWFQRAFDVVAADFDLDGDPDLILNGHHSGPLSLLENRDGVFVAVPVARSGLEEQRGVADVYAEREAIGAEIERRGESGLSLWHDPNRGLRWRFLWLDPGGRYEGARLRLRTSLRFAEHGGLEEAQVEAPDPTRLEIALSGPRQVFDVWPLRAAAQLRVDLSVGEPGAPPPPLFVGPDLVRFAAGSVDLWQPDPHGIAWVDVAGSPHPELYLARGALGGELAPPADPKQDRYYRATGGSPLYERTAPDAVPRDYARSRRVAWVDATGDGRLELSISRRDAPPVLRARTAAGGLRDLPAELPNTGATIAWGDLDGDARDDLFFLADDGVRVARQLGGGRFAVVGAVTLGTTLPAVEPFRGAVSFTALRLVDVDNDGDLDLFVFGRGAAGQVHLFRREGARFRDATEAMGLASARDVRAAAVLDVDADGDLDWIAFGPSHALWRNEPGPRFVREPLSHGVVRGPLSAATAVDVDADGRTDVVAVGRGMHLLRNVGELAAPPLDVRLSGEPDEPVGAVVTAVYADGRRHARRYGSADSSGFSQVLRPLRFARPEGVALEAIEVRWPGRPEPTRSLPDPQATLIELRRPAR